MHVFFDRASIRHYDPELGGAEMKSTTVTMLSKEDDDYLYVEAYSQMGFRLSNGFRIVGPCVLFPRSVLHWGVGCSCVLFPQSVWHWGQLGMLSLIHI